jgi:hypothetical protein
VLQADVVEVCVKPHGLVSVLTYEDDWEIPSELEGSSGVRTPASSRA